MTLKHVAPFLAALALGAQAPKKAEAPKAAPAKATEKAPEKAEAANVPAGTPTDDEKAIARLSRANALAYYERKRRKPSTCQSEFADDDKALAHLRSRLATRRVSREWLYDFVRFIYGHYEAGLAIPIADKLRSLGIEVADV